MNHRGQLLDKWGRVMEIDRSEFRQKRLRRPDDRPRWPRIKNPMQASVKPVR